MKFASNKVSLNLVVYDTFFNKLKGLMFRKKPIKDAYLLKNCNNIHTFFMKQNIDVLITDKDYKVLLKKENVKKNKTVICKKGKHTFELPINTVKNIKLGETIKIED
jgi:Uncharacterized ACR, COG1430.